MAADGYLKYVLSPLLHCLLLIQLLEYVPSASADGHCVWYGDCSSKTWFDRHLNCAYNGTALPIDEASRVGITYYVWATQAEHTYTHAYVPEEPLIEKYCPEIAAGGVSCCDHDQLVTLEHSIVVVEAVLSRCPSCLDNFMKHICGMTCAPDQSNFMKVLKVKQFNDTHQSVKEIDYHLSSTYMTATFNSCAEVELPNTDMLAMDVMCGEYGAENCTETRWFSFMGDATVPYVPFQINYIGGDEPAGGFTPYDPPTRPCNVGAPGKAACICYDCEESCF